MESILFLLFVAGASTLASKQGRRLTRRLGKRMFHTQSRRSSRTKSGSSGPKTIGWFRKAGSWAGPKAVQGMRASAEAIKSWSQGPGAVLASKARHRGADLLTNIADRLAQRISTDCLICGQRVKAAEVPDHVATHRTERVGSIPTQRSDPKSISTKPVAVRAAAVIEQGGTNMSAIKQVEQAFRTVAEAEPTNAVELDEILRGLSIVMTNAASHMASWAEQQDCGLGLDPRVTQVMYTAADSLSEVASAYHNARAVYRNVYAAQFEAMESGIRLPKKADFFQAT